MDLTKEDVYNKLIDVHKKSGQGLSGIVRVAGTSASKISQFLDELIQEGKVKCCETGGGIGHPESNRFYMPTAGYNVWEDEGDDGKYSRYKGRYLSHVRKYLGIEDNELFNMEKYFNSPEGSSDYKKWFEKNKDQLEVMVNLPDYQNT